VHLVEALVEVIKHLELAKCVILVQAIDLLNVDVRLVHRVSIRLVERQDFLLFSLKFAAQLSSLEDLFTKALVLLQLVCAVECIKGQCAKMLLLVATEVSHLLLE
jgi:hypothetical protein